MTSALENLDKAQNSGGGGECQEFDDLKNLHSVDVSARNTASRQSVEK